MVSRKAHDSRILGFQFMHYSPSKVRLQVNRKYMTTAQKSNCMFVGIDVHKDTHTAVGISPYGEKLFEITVGNYKEDFETLEEKVKEHSGVLSPYIGLEDVRGYGERLAGYLYEKYPVYHVSSILVDRQRQNATHPEKSDSLDALGVAKVMIQSIDTLLPYTISKESKKAKQLKEISIDREDLVLERTRLKNQVHTLLYRIYNTEYEQKFKDPFALKALRFWRNAKPKCDPFLLKTMKRKVRRLLDIHVEVVDLEKDMTTLLDLVATPSRLPVVAEWFWPPPSWEKSATSIIFILPVLCQNMLVVHRENALVVRKSDM